MPLRRRPGRRRVGVSASRGARARGRRRGRGRWSRRRLGGSRRSRRPHPGPWVRSLPALSRCAADPLPGLPVAMSEGRAGNGTLADRARGAMYGCLLAARVLRGARGRRRAQCDSDPGRDADGGCGGAGMRRDHGSRSGDRDARDRRGQPRRRHRRRGRRGSAQSSELASPAPA